MDAALDAREGVITGRAIIAALKVASVEFVLSVPDITTSDALLWPLTKDRDLRLIRVCKEDEAIGIASGLAFCDRRAVILIQQTGLMDSLNAVRATACEYHQPICFLVGLLGKEPGVAPAQSTRFGVRIVPGILDLMGVRHQTMETEADAALIAPAIEQAYTESEPTVLFIGRPPAP
jgi:sulfopyruvate decarboxylase TPP-binding subunit